jgi:hypothetical protein
MVRTEAQSENTSCAFPVQGESGRTVMIMSGQEKTPASSEIGAKQATCCGNGIPDRILEDWRDLVGALLGPAR